jgi:secreted PhoX family phosphatase
MKVLKPKFMLTRVYNDGSQDAPEIVSLSQSISEAAMNRRGFLGVALTAAAALTLLESCCEDDPGSKKSSGGRTCTCDNVGTCTCNTVCTCLAV